MPAKYLDNTGLSYFWSKIKAYVAGLLGAKADDASVVHLAGSETVSGSKTFTSVLTVSNTAANPHVMRLTSNDSSYAGIWDSTYSKWILYSDASGNASFVGNAATATNAERDSEGRIISTAYVRKEANEVINGQKTFIRSIILSDDIENPHEIVITSNQDTYAGIWDRLTEKWLVYANRNGDTYLKGQADSAVTDGAGNSIYASYMRLADSQVVTGTKTFTGSNLVVNNGNAQQPHQLAFGSNNSSYAGIWDSTYSKWLLYGNDSGNAFFKGAADSAAEFSSAKTVALTGDVTGSASSTGGWSVATTLASSGVAAGRYSSVAVDAKGRVTAGNVRHSYTTAASQAKAWLRIANANTSQIDATKPLHLQFFVRAQAQAAGMAYWQSWFVDLEVWGNQSGLRIFGTNSTSPFSQARVLYENTAESVSSSTRPAVDIYLNYVLAGGSVVEIEEVYNSGFEFVADGVLSASTIPSGYENRASAPYGNGVQYAGYADRTSLWGTNISANTTLNTSSHTRGALYCTGTITITVPSINSTSLWYFIKNYGTGVVTVHPASSSVYIDNVSANLVLQPGEYVQLACQSNAHYAVVNDGRWMSRLKALEDAAL